MWHIKRTSIKNIIKQECIPVGCVPPAHWLYLVVSYARPRKKPPTPPKNHACPPAKTMHAPPEQPRMPPGSNHAPLRSNHARPWEHPRMPPRATMHAPGSNLACPPQEQPHTTPVHPTLGQPCTPPQCGQTDTCKNITFANFVCGR